MDSLPRLLAGERLPRGRRGDVAARRNDRAIVWGIGAHVLKTGLSPILIDLMRRGFVSALATNGAGLIHDFEIALAGSTSEDVDAALGPGAFGMAHETGTELNSAIRDGVGRGLGIGQAVGALPARSASPRHVDILARRRAASLEIPVTVHVALGTDIIHMHPDASGAAIGEGQPPRLPLLRVVVSRGSNGGVYLELRFGGGPARGVPEGRRPGAKRRPFARGPDHCEPRLPPPLPPAGQCRRAVRPRASGAATRSPAITSC